MHHGHSATVTTDDVSPAHPDQGCAPAPHSLAVVATARALRTIVEFYASTGRPLPELGDC